MFIYLLAFVTWIVRPHIGQLSQAKPGWCPPVQANRKTIIEKQAGSAPGADQLEGNLRPPKITR